MKTLPMLVATALLFSAAVTAAKGDAASILRATDVIRNPDKPFSLDVTLTEYRDQQVRDRSTMKVYSKMSSRYGQFNNLVRILEPARDANKLLLKNGNEIWLFDPASKASVRVSAQQRMLGQAANGDVVTVDLSNDYNASLVGSEEVKDADGNAHTAFLLKLAARNQYVTYHGIEFWVDTTTSRPIKAKFYSQSQRLLKTAFYRRYEQQLQQMRPTETVIVDGLNPQWVTVMRYSNYQYRDIPDRWFNRDALAAFRD